MTSMSKDGDKRIRVGIIGANPDRGWAAHAHIPALRSLSDDFEITALSTTRRESADAARKLFGVPAAFANHQELVNNPAVDVVAGLQARSAPAVAYVRDLVEQGYVGEVLSTTLIGSGMGWGPTVEPFNAYLNDKKNGATMLSI